jgi:hypothetical protein
MGIAQLRAPRRGTACRRVFLMFSLGLGLLGLSGPVFANARLTPLPTPYALSAPPPVSSRQLAVTKEYSQALKDCAKSKSKNCAPGAKAALERASYEGFNHTRLSWDQRACNLLARPLSATADLELLRRARLDAAESCEGVADQSLLGNVRARWALRGLQLLDSAEAISATAQSMALRAAVRARRGPVRNTMDFDLLLVGVGTDRVAFDFFPWRVLWVQGGWGLTVHTFLVESVFQGADQLFGGHYFESDYARALGEPFSLELQKRLWDSGDNEGVIPQYPPYYGDGSSLNLYARACPWATAGDMVLTSGGPSTRTTNSWDSPEYWQGLSSAQNYEAGIKWETRTFEFDAGRCWILTAAKRTPREDMPALAFDEWFFRAMIRIF